MDDEDLIRWSLARGLRQRGHVVAEAPDAASALELIAARPVPFDVVLLDFRLPDRQDLTLLEDIRRLSPESAVFMMTAFGERQMRAGAIERGARAVVDKPFRVGDFITMIESAVN